MHFYLLRVPKFREICTSKHSNYHIFGELILKTRFPITYFFLGNKAKVLLRIFYYNALGAFFEALIQRTDGCTNLLWLLISHRQNILLAHSNKGSRPPYTPLLYSKTGVYRGIHFLLVLALKLRLWVHVSH